jgi:hypothetical protein
VKQYPRTFTEQSSYGATLRLLDRAVDRPGPAAIVLDLGCGRSPLAEPLAERGLVHVGCDVDREALADLAERGSETHEVSLLGSEDELAARLDAVVAGRPVAAVLALDVLEHLPDPRVPLRAVRRLSLDADGGPAPLVVSIPNVTHADVGAKLVLGRWDVDDTGLLDDTHLRFFGEVELGRLLAEGGWAVVDTDDVALDLSDQAFPTDAPSVRPGAPLRELLRAVRGRADRHATTYQFVRLLAPAEPTPAPYHHEVDEDRPLLAAVVVSDLGGDDEVRPLVADLAAQDPSVAVTVAPRAGLDDALAACEARWVAVLHPGTRLAAGWSARVAGLAQVGAGHVLRVGAVAVPDAELRALPADPFDGGAPAGAEPLAPGAFDPLHAAPPSATAVGAYLVPIEVVHAAGVTPGPDRPGRHELSLWVARAVQAAGLVGDDEPVVAVAHSALLPPGTWSAVTAALDAEPLLLPPGSAGRLEDLRARVVAGERARDEALRRAEAAEHKAAHYADHLRRLDHDARAERAELEKLREWNARRPSRRLVALLRRSGLR